MPLQHGKPFLDKKDTPSIQIAYFPLHWNCGYRKAAVYSFSDVHNCWHVDGPSVSGNAALKEVMAFFERGYLTKRFHWPVQRPKNSGFTALSPWESPTTSANLEFLAASSEHIRYPLEKNGQDLLMGFRTETTRPCQHL